MTRQTSLDAYEAIKPHLSAARWRVFCYVLEQPGMTAKDYEAKHNDRHCSKRFSELEAMAVIEARGTFDGALCWFPTGKQPQPLPRRETWKQKAQALQRQVAALEAQAVELRAAALMAKAELVASRIVDERAMGRVETWSLKAPTN